MRVHLCGVRGSTPAVGAEFTGVGGNTSCVALAHDDEATPRLVLDAGTGLRAVSALMSGEPFRGSILLGHLHWDHTQGLPFFRAADRPDAVTRVLVPEQGCPPLELLERFMGAAGLSASSPRSCSGSWSFESIDEGVHAIEGFTVLAREIPHKGGRTMGYRDQRWTQQRRLPVRSRPRPRCSVRAPMVSVRITRRQSSCATASTC